MPRLPKRPNGHTRWRSMVIGGVIGSLLLVTLPAQPASAFALGTLTLTTGFEPSEAVLAELGDGPTCENLVPFDSVVPTGATWAGAGVTEIRFFERSGCTGFTQHIWSDVQEPADSINIEQGVFVGSVMFIQPGS